MKTIRQLIAERLMRYEWFVAIAEAAIDIQKVNLEEQRETLTDAQNAYIDEYAAENR